MVVEVDQTDADLIVFIDGNGTYPVSYLGLIIDPILWDKADIAVGSKALGTRVKRSTSLFNRIAEGIWFE